MFMLHSLAIGGPLDGVKLSADDTWNGRVRLSNAPKNQDGPEAYHPGHYYWRENAWVWRTASTKRPAPGISKLRRAS